MAVELVVFDMAGTTVDDSVDGVPLVAVAMQEGFKMHGLDISLTQVNKVRGMEKKEAIKNVLTNLGQTESEVDDIFVDFKKSLNSHLQFINKEIPETSNVFKELRSNGVKVSVGSGFPHSVVETIVENLHWSGLVDYVSSAEKVGHGRPNPAMIHAAMKHCGVEDVHSVVKVGDTKADIQEGKNAGCWTVAVLTGTQTRHDLENVKPDFIIDSIANLFDVLAQINSKSDEGCSKI
ncbi:uncharacterized protein LOC110231471 [Exaiptasia diaphana]|uniref:Phosphonoacetaldehyde hydrolase n=1 Tax=Exaiptasia diaphana TaxID=2652724 RepID=A0A913WPK7_EXADI|nr:uncharacterized protein LOC110231471 [Exaiptasia diaphana]